MWSNWRIHIDTQETHYCTATWTLCWVLKRTKKEPAMIRSEAAVRPPWQPLRGGRWAVLVPAEVNRRCVSSSSSYLSFFLRDDAAAARRSLFFLLLLLLCLYVVVVVVVAALLISRRAQCGGQKGITGGGGSRRRARRWWRWRWWLQQQQQQRWSLLFSRGRERGRSGPSCGPNGLREDRNAEPGLPLRGRQARLHTVHQVGWFFWGNFASRRGRLIGVCCRCNCLLREWIYPGEWISYGNLCLG